MRKKEESIEKREERLNKIGKEKLLEEIAKNAREEADSIVEKAEGNDCTAENGSRRGKGEAARAGSPGAGRCTGGADPKTYGTGNRGQAQKGAASAERGVY